MWVHFQAQSWATLRYKEDSERERDHIKGVLRANGYKDWVFDLPPPRIRLEPDPQEKKIYPQPLPYVKGLTERLAKTFRKFETKVYYKPFNTIRSQLVHPKDKTTLDKKCAVVYHIDCGGCDLAYIGETARSLSCRVKEHTSIRRASLTAVGDHCKKTGHEIHWENVKVLSSESNTSRRKIREAIEIEANKPALNRDIGSYEIPRIYRTLLRRDNTAQQTLTTRQSDEGHAT